MKYAKSLIENKVRMLLVIGIAFLSIANMGCSTPAIPDSSDPSEAADEAGSSNWEAYQDCLSSMPTTSTNTYACDNVGGTTVSSQSSYTGSNTSGSSGPRGAYQSSPTKQQLVDAYKSYLATREPASLVDMNHQWKQIATENRSLQLKK